MPNDLSQVAGYAALILATAYAAGFIIAAAFFGGDKGLITYHVALFRLLRTGLGGCLVALGSMFRTFGTSVRGKQRSKKDQSH